MRNFIGTLAAILPLAAAAPYGVSPRDSNPGCTSTSFGDFSWTIKSFTYRASYIFTTPAHQNSWGYVNFNLTNPALLGEVACSAQSSQLYDFFYGNFNYNCILPTGSTTKTSFDFNRPSGQLDINQTWTCSDEDPQYPVTFSAYGTVNLTLNCTTSYYQNPNWQPGTGAFYSDEETTCAPVTLPLTPHDKTAVA
ncbi:hypothetical protein HD806DRAFT_538281 [Xylariaceae sp. AK1471]|nr:hypothetical protein HD806DRAFT_538281 [Xylariaceae sp. AK1471]